MTSALLVVDVQVDFTEGGRLAVIGGAECARNISAHIKEHGSDYDYIIASKDWHVDPGDHFSSSPDYVTTWPEHCTVGSEGANFHPELVKEFKAVFHKGEYAAAYSAFEGREAELKVTLDDWLYAQEVDSLYVCGIALDYCVRATVNDSVGLNYNTILLPELTVAVDGENFDKIWMDIQKETGCQLYVGS